MPEPIRDSNIGLYRSGVTSPERLRHTSVAREQVLGNSVESLRGSVGRKSKQHLLFIGPRGIGKTHLLDWIEDTVQSDENAQCELPGCPVSGRIEQDIVLRRFSYRPMSDPERCCRRRTAMGGVVRQGTDRGRQRSGSRHHGARNPRTESPE